ncbi:MAG: flagellin lysine-N-methylase [Oscillospiraceae bacterium]|nr:flagellin lysine-N-methylase [Oscillospiraceae bacterium]
MKTIVPHYYSDFKCKAGECRHSCCIGWEIDIDPITLQKYNSMETDFGTKIRDNIDFQNECTCFKLSEDERCPFLSGQNLCEIILILGEEALCDICTDHPRFRHFYSDRIEIGLGICCEEACRIILSDNRPFSLIPDCENDVNLTSDEFSFFEERDVIFKAVESSDSVFSAVNKINEMYSLTSVEWNLCETADFFSSLEMLDPAWKDKLLLLKAPKKSNAEKQAEKAFINLYKYFLFRHLTDVDFYEALRFSEISVKLIWAICERTDFSFENICEIARAYSSEIEYSDENTVKVIEFAEG